jgi:5'-methylthioadenosine nucleosidase
MEAEAAPFVEHLQLKLDDSVFPPNVPFLAYSGPHGHARVTVVTNGKDTIYSTGVDNCGTVPAAMATFLALQTLPNTDLLINAGTSGGFARKGAAIGDVFLTTAVAHHDRRIPIPDFVPYGIGKLNSTIVEHLQTLAQRHNYKLGVCTTGNSLDKTDEDDEHMLANEASVKDMEAAAIAWSCALHNKTFLGVKVVTDIVDGERPTQDEFLENLHTASKSLQENLPKVLDYLIGLEHDEL